MGLIHWRQCGKYLTCMLCCCKITHPVIQKFRNFQVKVQGPGKLEPEVQTSQTKKVWKTNLRTTFLPSISRKNRLVCKSSRRNPEEKHWSEGERNRSLAILCALFGMVKWPFKGLSDLQLGDKKVTLNHLVHNKFLTIPWKSLATIFYRLVSEFHHYFSRGWQHLPKGTTMLKMVVDFQGIRRLWLQMLTDLWRQKTLSKANNGLFNETSK